MTKRDTGKAWCVCGGGESEALQISSGAGRRWREGSTPQISRAYWAMVRSLENLPEVAMFLITIRVHSLGFWNASSGVTLPAGSPQPGPPSFLLHIPANPQLRNLTLYRALTFSWHLI